MLATADIIALQARKNALDSARVHLIQRGLGVYSDRASHFSAKEPESWQASMVTAGAST